MISNRPSKVSDDQLLAAVGVDDARFARRPRLTTWRDVPAEELRRAVAVSDGYAQVARLVGLGESAAAQRRAKALIVRAGSDTAHFRAVGWSRGPVRAPEPLSAVLVRGRHVPTSKLRVRLVKEGLLTAACANCERVEWQGAPIPLELDHINGDRLDNRLENLRLLCPNCHAGTDTYRGRNIGAPRAPAARPEREGESSTERARRRLSLVVRQAPAYVGPPPP